MSVDDEEKASNPSSFANMLARDTSLVENFQKLINPFHPHKTLFEAITEKPGLQHLVHALGIDHQKQLVAIGNSPKPKKSPQTVSQQRTYESVLTPKHLGDLIRAARKAKNLSQQEMADLAGVGRRFLSELENGKPSLEFGKVITVANAIGIDLFAKRR